MQLRFARWPFGAANLLRYLLELDHPTAGRVLVAGSIQSLPVREGNKLTTLSAGLTVYRVGADGKLGFVRKYDVDTGKATQFWSGMVTLG